MPIRKKSGAWIIDKEVETSENNETKHCPFCDNVIKAKAVKCQYCWEFLNEWKKGNEKQKSIPNYEVQSSNISALPAIKAWKTVYRWYIWMFIRLWIAFLAWMADADFIESDGFNALDILISLTPVVLLMIWSNKTYGYLLNNKVKNLRFDSTWWPTRWWICPIACLYIPYQAVRDIFKTFNEKYWIVWWRWACYLMSSILLRFGDVDDTWFLNLLGLWVLIAEYVLMINIVKNINNSLWE